jgi:hypothetical protein
MSGERPDFQQPTGITSQRGGVASAEEFAAQSEDVGVNVDIRTLAAGNSVFVNVSPNSPDAPVVIQRVVSEAEGVPPSEVSLSVVAGIQTFTGDILEFNFAASQTPISFSPGVFLVAGQGYSLDIANNGSSSATISTTVVLRRVS